MHGKEALSYTTILFLLRSQGRDCEAMGGIARAGCEQRGSPSHVLSLCQSSVADAGRAMVGTTSAAESHRRDAALRYQMVARCLGAQDVYHSRIRGGTQWGTMGDTMAKYSRTRVSDRHPHSKMGNFCKPRPHGKGCSMRTLCFTTGVTSGR